MLAQKKKKITVILIMFEICKLFIQIFYILFKKANI